MTNYHQPLHLFIAPDAGPEWEFPDTRLGQIYNSHLTLSEYRVRHPKQITQDRLSIGNNVV